MLQKSTKIKEKNTIGLLFFLLATLHSITSKADVYAIFCADESGQQYTVLHDNHKYQSIFHKKVFSPIKNESKEVEAIEYLLQHFDFSHYPRPVSCCATALNNIYNVFHYDEDIENKIKEILEGRYYSAFFITPNYPVEALSASSGASKWLIYKSALFFVILYATSNYFTDGNMAFFIAMSGAISCAFQPDKCSAILNSSHEALNDLWKLSGLSKIWQLVKEIEEKGKQYRLDNNN